MNRFKREAGLGMTGAIVGTAAFSYSLYNMLKYYPVYSLLGLSIFISLGLLLAAVIFSFTGFALLRQGRKSGGVFVLLAGIAAVLSPVFSFSAAWTGLLAFPLLMLSGALAIAKRMPDGTAPMGETYINNLSGLH